MSKQQIAGVNIFDFSAKPGGYRFTNGNFFGLTSEAGYWTSTELDQESAWQRFIAFNREGIYRYNFDKQFGLFVRCLKDQAND
nr:hypothetical protein [Bacteroidota bacterium]